MREPETMKSLVALLVYVCVCVCVYTHIYLAELLVHRTEALCECLCVQCLHLSLSYRYVKKELFLGFHGCVPFHVQQNNKIHSTKQTPMQNKITLRPLE